MLAHIANTLMSIFNSKPFDERNNAEKKLGSISERASSGFSFFKEKKKEKKPVVSLGNESEKISQSTMNHKLN
jgi:hypothetical protein